MNVEQFRDTLLRALADLTNETGAIVDRIEIEWSRPVRAVDGNIIVSPAPHAISFAVEYLVTNRSAEGQG